MCLLPEDSSITYLINYAGNSLKNFCPKAEAPFSTDALSLLHELSTKLMSEPDIRQHPDIVSFAYWCRQGNLKSEAHKRSDGLMRIGRTLAFHISPGNVPINFAFSWAFGLLAGCSNVVRLATRKFPQAALVLKHISALLSESRFSSQAVRNIFIRYPASQRDITAALCARSDARVIWGGDATVSDIRSFPVKPRCVDVVFADRYAFCVLDALHVLNLSSEQQRNLAENFYNDCFIMDQNACSSPHLVVWLGDEAVTASAQAKFWSAVRAVVRQRYTLEPVMAMDRLVQLCRDALELDENIEFFERNSVLYRVKLRTLFPGMESRRGKGGYFYEFGTHTLNAVAPIVTDKYQTMTYAGVSNFVLHSFVRDNALTGIDRVVPVGKALDIGLIWDGFDMIQSLSRVCKIE